MAQPNNNINSNGLQNIQIPTLISMSPNLPTTVFLPIQASNIMQTRTILQTTPTLIRAPMLTPFSTVQYPTLINSRLMVPQINRCQTKPIAPKTANMPVISRITPRIPRPITPTVREELERRQKKKREEANIPLQLVINQPNQSQIQYMQFTPFVTQPQRKIAPKVSSSMPSILISPQTVSPIKTQVKEESVVDPNNDNNSISSTDSLCKLTDFISDDPTKIQLKSNIAIKNEQSSGNDAEEDDENILPPGYEEIEFQWGEYLELTNSKACNEDAFEHVVRSLSSCIKPNMIVDVEHKKNTFWPARIQIVAGPVLNLKYIGANSTDKELWLKPSQVHPYNSKINEVEFLRKPPYEIKSNHENWAEVQKSELQDIKTPLEYVFGSDGGTTAIDFIKNGQVFEIQHYKCCALIWPVKVIRNVGGRLLLRFFGVEREKMSLSSNETRSYPSDFWLFFLHHRLHPIGWGKLKGLSYKPIPEIVDQHTPSEWEDVLRNAFNEGNLKPPPIDLFLYQKQVSKHNFKQGDKLEALHPLKRSKFYPASVEEVLNKYYFIVELDIGDGEEVVRMCCHSNSDCIFPINTCKKYDLKLSLPKNYKSSEFRWEDYLEKSKSKPAPEDSFNNTFFENTDKFEVDTKLEFVNPENSDEICPSTIEKIVGKLLFLHLDSETSKTENFIVSSNSMNIFPVGWCDSNDYELKLPHKSRLRYKISICENVDDEDDSFDIDEGDCPVIYFNNNCFSGPYLNKGQLLNLPKSVGPGPLEHVLTEVLGKLINIAYKPSFVLRLLTAHGESKPAKSRFVSLKAKYKGRQYRATAEICKSVKKISEYCKMICSRLECCKNLFSIENFDNQCPERCYYNTKTKGNKFGKKRRKRIGRPPNTLSLLVSSNETNKKLFRKNLTNDLEKEDGASASDSVSFPKRHSKKKRKFDNFVVKEEPNSDNELLINIAPLEEPNFKRVKDDFKTKTISVNNVSSADNTLLQTTVSIMSNGNGLINKTEPKFTTSIVKTLQNNNNNNKDVNKLHLESNPVGWTIDDVIKFLINNDCKYVVPFIREQEIDGQALLLLNLQTVQDCLPIKLGPAIKFCHQIERLQGAYIKQLKQFN